MRFLFVAVAEFKTKIQSNGITLEILQNMSSVASANFPPVQLLHRIFGGLLAQYLEFNNALTV